MKVLLIGEFSGYHRALRDGLRALGHDAVVAGTGDGNKFIPVDIDIGSRRGGLVGKLDRIAKAHALVSTVAEYDVVQVINPWVFPRGLGLNSKLLRDVRMRSKKMFLSACGDDAFFVQKGINELRYSPIPDAMRIDFQAEVHPLDNDRDLAWNDEIAEFVDGVIPVMHEYHVGYADRPNCRPTIPLPINLEETQYIENTAREKILFMHGAGRTGFKGTNYILGSFEVIAEKFPGQCEFAHIGNLPVGDYLSYMRRVNVVVDQTSSYSCGMNALFALAMGKVVLGGAEPESFEMYGGEVPPVLNIRPQVQDIVETIRGVLERREELHTLGERSRLFVERHHDHRKIASRYLAEWER